MKEQLKQIEADVQDILERLEELRQKSKDDEFENEISYSPGYFPAKKGDEYHTPRVYENIQQKWANDKQDLWWQNMGLICRTREEAEFVVRKKEAYCKLVTRISELNGGWVPNWEDDEYKYHFYLESDTDSLKIVGKIYVRILPDELHFESRQRGIILHRELGVDLIKLAIWGIE
jgi:hypothetical protein